ncbi:glycine cleavage system H protein [mine drainage metagenome]|uniref:Glycine cleavage system H protein n=1 Tax=mine drainage metagenome TaxID=410659 RepID=A0A1J5PP06_9ZZZZ
MSSVPEDLRYTSEHEWLASTTGVTKVGITDFAQEALGDIVYVQLPTVGSKISAGAVCGEVESTKSVSEIYAPVSGSVTAINEQLTSKPELINSEPYAGGWLFEVEVEGTPTGLLSPEEYRAATGS